MVQTVPSLAELKDHRARAPTAFWLSPTVEWHASLGVASIAKCDLVHMGAFGHRLSLSDSSRSSSGHGSRQSRPTTAARSRSSLQCLLHTYCCWPGWRFATSRRPPRRSRAGRYWSLVLAAFAHDDLMHVGFNALALSRAAPALQARLKARPVGVLVFCVAASRCAF